MRSFIETYLVALPIVTLLLYVVNIEIKSITQLLILSAVVSYFISKLGSEK